MRKRFDYGGHHTIPDRTHKDSIRERAAYAQWKKSPLLFKNPSQDFEVFIGEHKLVDEQVVIRGENFIFTTKDLHGKEIKSEFIKFDEVGPTNLQFEVGYAVKKFKIQVLQEEYFQFSQEVEDLIENFIQQRSDWSSLSFDNFAKNLQNLGEKNRVPKSYCDGALEFAFGLFEYDNGHKEFSDKLLVANAKLLPWFALSDFAWFVVTYIHFIRNQWGFLSEVGIEKECYLSEAFQFYTNQYGRLEKLRSNKSDAKDKLQINRNFLLKEDLTTLDGILDFLSEKGDHRKGRYSDEEYEGWGENSIALSYPQSLTRRFLLQARFCRKANDQTKTKTKYKQLRTAILEQPDGNCDWLKEADDFLEK